MRMEKGGFYSCYFLYEAAGKGQKLIALSSHYITLTLWSELAFRLPYAQAQKFLAFSRILSGLLSPSLPPHLLYKA